MSGPMRAYLDAVRYISNTSTGRLGTKIADQCLRRGAQVTFVFGTGSETPQPTETDAERLTLIEIETLPELLEVLRKELQDGKPQACIQAMAILDYIPEETNGGKISSDLDSLTVRLVRAPKVIEQVKNISPTTFLVGFKLEVNVADEGLIASARELMNRSQAEVVVGNDLARIQGEEHPAFICERVNGDLEVEKVSGKTQIARALCEIFERRVAPTTSPDAKASGNSSEPRSGGLS